MTILAHGLRPPLQRPPVGAPIDWANPLTDGLVFAAPLNDWSSTTINNVFAGQAGAFTGTASPAWGSIAGDQALTFPGSAYVDYGLDRNTELLSTIPWTLMCRLLVTGATEVLSRCDGNGSHGWLLDVTSLLIPTVTYIGGGGNGGFRPALPLSSGVWSTIAFVDHAGTAAANTTSFYVDGADFGLSLNNPASGHLAPTAFPLQIGQTCFGTFNGALAFVYMWARALGPGEVAALTAQPYAIFADPLRAVYDELPVFLAGTPPPGGYTFPALTVAA